MENSAGSATPQKPRTYYAFISYSHRDSVLVRRLHREMEQYRVPQRLLGKPSPVTGVIPRRLNPIFLDREELPSSANLGTPIHETLSHSYTLIAACSPYSAVSRWVNGEVQYFKQIGKADRVMCVILDGEPNATDKPELGKPECFCPALRHAVDTEGRLTERREEPLAADIRREADGWKRAKLKLIAGMLGISFDELNQRERERMRVRHAWQLATAIIVVIAACIGGFFGERVLSPSGKPWLCEARKRGVGPTPLSRGRTLRRGIGKRAGGHRGTAGHRAGVRQRHSRSLWRRCSRTPRGLST